jgi:hypothetical protein
VLDALRARGGKIRTTRSGFEAQCPAHEDRNPSMHVSEGGGGKVLVHCHRGCTFAEIMQALGLEEREAFCNGDTPRPAPAPIKSSTHPDAQMATDALVRRHGAPSATHEYRDQDRELRGLVLRWDRGQGRKDFRALSRDAAGRWQESGMPPPRLLYRLPELVDAPPSEPVWVMEGEKCADAGAGCGLVCVASPHGSNSAHKSDWTPLAGRDVVLVPDNDGEGDKYAEAVGGLARDAGARSVRVVALSDLWPGLPPKGDIVDLLEHWGGDADRVREAVLSLVFKDESDVGEGKDVSDARDGSDDRDETDAKDGQDGISGPSGVEGVEDPWQRYLGAYALVPAAQRQLQGVFRAVRLMIQDEREPTDAGPFGALISERYPRDWPNGQDEAALAITQAFHRYDPDLDTLSRAMEWARERDRSSLPTCIQHEPSDTARLVFLVGVRLAMQNGSRDFWVSQEALAQAIGVTQPMVSQSIRYKLCESGLWLRTFKGRTGKASEYRLFADPDAILDGAMPDVDTGATSAVDSDRGPKIPNGGPAPRPAPGSSPGAGRVDPHR